MERPIEAKFRERGSARKYTIALHKYIDHIEADREDISDFIQFVISKNDELINDFSLIAYGAEYRTNNNLKTN